MNSNPHVDTSNDIFIVHYLHDITCLYARQTASFANFYKRKEVFHPVDLGALLVASLQLLK
jgi:hypothetical protein